jgi:hypothetical protein
MVELHMMLFRISPVRISRVLAIAGAVSLSLSQIGQSVAREAYWQGDSGTTWNTTTNWFTVGAPSGGAFVPQVTGSVNARAIIGTDSPNGALDSTLAPAVSPIISAALASPKDTIGGLYLGLRERNLLVTPPTFPNPAPAAGTLVGSLTISGGTLNNISTTDAGADGRIVVGSDGRGYLTMTGGTLTGIALVVGGENNSSGNGTSLLSMSGNASLTVSSTAQFSRRLRVEGPDATVAAANQIRLDASNTYTAAITSASQHSALTGTAALSTATIGGTLNIEFSGAAATRDPIASLGTTWDLVRVNNLADNAITGTFSNEGNGRSVTVSGLDAAHSAPLGATYRLKKAIDGPNTELQLSYEQVLVLQVNRDTGELKIRNPLTGNIAIDSYSVTSARGSMVTSYAGLGAGTPNAGVWVKPTPPGGNNANALSEVKEPDVTVPIVNDDAYNLLSVPSVSLGNGFSKTAVGAGGANFGIDGEDLVFEYGGPATGDVPIRGQIEYIGTKFENDLVLRVNPTTGQAFLKNDTLVPRTIDGYSILSSTGSLIGGSFAGGLGGSWQTTSPPTANAITQTNLTGSTTLAAGAQLAIGDISATGFLDDATKNGLSLQFAIATGGAVPGDYNNDGAVNAADYTTWRDNLGAPIALTNQNPAAATPAVVDQEDYNFWKANFGSTGAGETTFRVGSVVFDEAAGAGGGSFAVGPVPEPSTFLLAFAGIGSLGMMRRRRGAPTNEITTTVPSGASPEMGAPSMSTRTGQMLAAFVAGCTMFLTTFLTTSFLATSPANAAVQAIPLINGDFEQPGPPGGKVVAFDNLGDPIPGIIPGWTFTGGSGNAATGETIAGKGNSLFNDNVPGDSGTEGGGSPGNDLLLSTLDGKVFQTSAGGLTGPTPFPATQKLRFSFDARNIFTPVGLHQLTARLYYVDVNSVKQTVGSPLVLSTLTGAATNYSLEFLGNDPAQMALLTPALNRPLGVEFDTTSYESDTTVGRLESWSGIDDVVLQIIGIKRGDLNGDGSINNADYLILRDNMQKSSLYEFEGELTGDAKIDLNDFRVFKNLFAAGGSGTIDFSGSGVPEPATWMLMLLSTLAAGIIRRRRAAGSSRICTWSIVVGTAVIALSLSTESKAEQLAYDPFRIGGSPGAGEYVLSSTAGDPPVISNPLAGQNPTIGPASPSFFRDAWATASPGQTVINTSLSYRGTDSIGGAVSGYGRSQRYLREAWTETTTGTFYISAQVNFGTTNTGAMGYRAMEFYPPNVVPNENRNGDIGYNQFFSNFGAAQQAAATAKIQINMLGNQQIIQPSPDSYLLDGADHLLVLKFELSATAASDKVSLFFDPTTKTEPSGPTNVFENVDWVLGAIGSASFDNDAHGGTTIFDELRVGTSYVDVVPADLPLPGDTNGDDLVNIVDYQAIISHMNQPGARTLAEGDVTGDGKVTIADFRFWKARRSLAAPGEGSVALGVPEPSALLLILAGLAFGACSRRIRTSHG